MGYTEPSALALQFFCKCKTVLIKSFLKTGQEKTNDNVKKQRGVVFVKTKCNTLQRLERVEY